MFQELANYTDQELMTRLREVALNEKQFTAKFIAHLAEVKRRELHLKFGYGTIREYCEVVLKIDAGQVYLRSQIASFAMEFPRVLELIAEGALSLTTASKLAPIINKDNAGELFERCRDKTKRQLDEILVCYQPKPAFEPAVRLIERELFSDESLPHITSVPEAISLEVKDTQTAGQTNNMKSSIQTNVPPKPFVQPATESRFNLKFSISVTLKKKMERLAQLKNLDPVRNLEKILELAIDASLKEHELKSERHKGKATTATDEERGGKSQFKQPNPKILRRAIPRATRRLVFERAEYQCEFRGTDGHRCTAKHDLQIDHIRPWSKLGDHDIQNLRLACRAHNLWKARCDFGSEFIANRLRLDEKVAQNCIKAKSS